jgi:flagellar biosynthesis/type III secretory pathway M-ring protein FliF/YscJ
MSVAVIINSSQMTAEDIAKYRELVAFSAGVPVENVALTYSKFLGSEPVYQTPNPEDDEPEDIFDLIEKKLLIIVGAAVLGVIIIIVVVAIIISNAKNKKRKRRLAEVEKELREQAEKKAMPSEIVLNETREQALKRQIKEFTAQNAETVAQLLRVWIKEDESR